MSRSAAPTSSSPRSPAPPSSATATAAAAPATRRNFRKLVKLAQSYDIIHTTGGYPVEPIDIHASVRHLDCLSDMVKLTDKVFHCYSLGQQRNLDGIEIARIGRGVSMEQMETEPSIFTIINSSSRCASTGRCCRG